GRRRTTRNQEADARLYDRVVAADARADADRPCWLALRRRGADHERALYVCRHPRLARSGRTERQADVRLFDPLSLRAFRLPGDRSHAWLRRVPGLERC